MNTKGTNTIVKKKTDEQRKESDYNRLLHSIENADYNKKSKEIILKYNKKHIVENSSIETRRLYLTALHYLAQCFPKKDILKLSLTSDGDMGTFMLWLGEERSKRTKAYYLNYLRTFYKTYLPEDKVKKDMKFVSKLMSELSQKLKAEDYASLEEVYDLVNGATSKKDKCAIIMGWESALRVLSFSKIQLKHIKHLTSADGKDSYKIEVPVENIKGKKEKCQPIVVLVKSVPYLQDWLEEHRFKDDPDAWLFYSAKSKDKAEKLRSKSFTLMLQRTAKRIGFEKKATWHCLRNWRTKWLIENGYNSEVIKKMNGWSKNSNMLQVYSDFGEEDVQRAVSQKEGLIPEEVEEKKFDPVICPRCKTTNKHNALFCSKCWLGLKPEAADEIESKDLMLKNMQKMVDLAVEKQLKNINK